MIDQTNQNQVLQDWDQVLESVQMDEMAVYEQTTSLPEMPFNRKSGWPQNRKRKYQYYMEQTRSFNNPGKKQMNQLWLDLQAQKQETRSKSANNWKQSPPAMDSVGQSDQAVSSQAAGLQSNGPGQTAARFSTKTSKALSKVQSKPLPISQNQSRSQRIQPLANGFLLGEALLALLICMISGFLLFSSAGALAKSQSLEITHEMQAAN